MRNIPVAAPSRRRSGREVGRSSRIGAMRAGHALPYEVNCSILFTELPLLEWPAAARRGPRR